MKIFVNARCLSKQLTGIPRYLVEILRQKIFQEADIKLLSPCKFFYQGFKGHLWEQTVLPLKCGKDVLWSPANCGPAFLKNQVVTVHDVAFLDVPETYNKKYVSFYKRMFPTLCSNAKKLIAVSNFTKERVIELLSVPQEKITVVPNGVSGFNAPSIPEINTVREKYKIPSNSTLLLSVCTLDPRKNLDSLLRSFSIVRQKMKDVFLILVGGSNKNVFNSLHLPEVEGVIFAGHVSDKELGVFYHIADVFAYLSKYEGFGLPPLEAMACGTAVLASNIPPIMEFANGAAELVSPHSIDEIAGAMENLLSNETYRSQLAPKGLERSKQYTWERTANETMRVLGDGGEI